MIPIDGGQYAPDDACEGFRGGNCLSAPSGNGTSRGPGRLCEGLDRRCRRVLKRSRFRAISIVSLKTLTPDGRSTPPSPLGLWLNLNVLASEPESASPCSACVRWPLLPEFAAASASVRRYRRRRHRQPRWRNYTGAAFRPTPRSIRATGSLCRRPLYRSSTGITFGWI